MNTAELKAMTCKYQKTIGAGDYEEKFYVKCGLCGTTEVFETEYDLLDSSWIPYAYLDGVEVSPVCPHHSQEELKLLEK